MHFFITVLFKQHGSQEATLNMYKNDSYSPYYMKNHQNLNYVSVSLGLYAIITLHFSLQNKYGLKYLKKDHWMVQWASDGDLTVF